MKYRMKKMSNYEKATQCMKEKDYENAVKFFEKAVENMENPKAGVMLKKAKEEYGEDVNKIGDQLYKKKKYKEAMEYYLESIQLEMDAGEDRKVKKYTEELRKATEKLAKEINKKGDKLMKDDKYEEAISVYMESVDLMSKAGNQKKLENFKGELNKALMKHAEELIDLAKDLAKDDKLDDAVSKIKEASTNAKRTGSEKFINNIEDDSKKIFEIVADETNDRGDDAFKKKKYKEAIKLYKRSVDLIKKSGDERKLKRYKKELSKAFEERAEDINDAGDKAYKEGDYESAIEIYQQSIDMAEQSGDEKQIENYKKELAKSFEKLAKEVNDKGDKLYKEGKYEDAGHIYLRSIQLAQQSKKEKLVKNFTKELRKTYEKWADEVNDKGDDLYKEKKYDEAIEAYKQSVVIAETANDEKTIEKYTKELKKAYKKYSEDLNSEGDAAYKSKDYEKAYELYQKSVEMAMLSGDTKNYKRFSKERDKALRKLQ
ncbi:MAG: hypothetical protein GF364_02255 [Candidatus Lokiarchaeota archaeon]|nr:hypothetical protein [Candidatus Lokiarchaeota archaeon]